MITNGNADFKATILVGLNQSTILCACCTVNSKVTSLNRVGGVLIINHTRHLEATYILKLDIVMCQRVAAYITGMVDGVKLMNTQYRTHQIGGTVATEGHTTNHIVTILISEAIDRELLLGGHHLRDNHTLSECMVAVGHTIGLTIVIHAQHTVDALIHGPVGEQVLLGA